MNITIIGAGIGGLSAACLLAAKGHNVTILEKNDTIGGKMNEVRSGGYRFDTGPSLFTMPHILDGLFRKCGTSIEEQLKLIPLRINCRYFYPDGVIFDNYANQRDTLSEIEKIAPEDAAAYSKFLGYCESLYKKTSDSFIFNPLYDWSDLTKLNLLSFFGIDAFTTVSKRVDTYFKSNYLRQFFKRFTTYNGSSPYLAPATLNVIPHVELNQGGYYVEGGLYQVALSLLNLAVSMGVTIQVTSHVDRIHILGARVKGVETTSGELYETDLVVANCDATETILNLIDDASISLKRKESVARLEPSSSGFVILLGVKKHFDQLRHHNIFFSQDYKEEFNQIFHENRLPEDPTIYIANTSYTDSGHAPEGCSNLFVLVNAPYLTDEENPQEASLYHAYADHVIQKLEKCGLDGLFSSIELRHLITPKDFYQNYLSNKGSIYGTSSNSRMSAFIRPRNKSREIKGLYFVGGSTHPGGGIPLAVQSAHNAVELIHRYEG